MGPKEEGKFFVYKRGQVTAIPMLNGKLQEIYLQPARDDPQERLINLRYLRASASCKQIGRNAQPIVDFLAFVISDAGPMIRSSEDAEILQQMRQARDMWTSVIQGKD